MGNIVSTHSPSLPTKYSATPNSTTDDSLVQRLRFQMSPAVPTYDCLISSGRYEVVGEHGLGEESSDQAKLLGWLIKNVHHTLKRTSPLLPQPIIIKQEGGFTQSISQEEILHPKYHIAQTVPCSAQPGWPCIYKLKDRSCMVLDEIKKSAARGLTDDFISDANIGSVTCSVVDYCCRHLTPVLHSLNDIVVRLPNVLVLVHLRCPHIHWHNPSRANLEVNMASWTMVEGRLLRQQDPALPLPTVLAPALESACSLLTTGYRLRETEEHRTSVRSLRAVISDHCHTLWKLACDVMRRLDPYCRAEALYATDRFLHKPTIFPLERLDRSTVKANCPERGQFLQEVLVWRDVWTFLTAITRHAPKSPLLLYFPRQTRPFQQDFVASVQSIKAEISDYKVSAREFAILQYLAEELLPHLTAIVDTAQQQVSVDLAATAAEFDSFLEVDEDNSP